MMPALPDLLILRPTSWRSSQYLVWERSDVGFPRYQLALIFPYEERELEPYERFKIRRPVERILKDQCKIKLSLYEKDLRCHHPY